ncbi:MAG: hypothetical protein QOD63_2622 [Actinomycetota bacterium]|nr:hypothetical protein [Actinomycetota bacterium]
MLLYGDAPATGEPTLELLRRPLPTVEGGVEAARVILERAFTSWGWTGALDAATGCIGAVLAGLADSEPDAMELFAFRRAHQLTVEVHYSGVATRFHQAVVDDPARARAAGRIDRLAPLWGVRPLNDGEAVWFEFR